MTTTEWNNTFKTMLVPCTSDRKRSTTGSTTFCTFAAKPGIALKDLGINIQGTILKYCCPIRKDVECLVEHRNKDYGHIKTASLSDVDFNDFLNETQDCLLNIARMCGKEQEVKDVIRHFRVRPVDATLCSRYQNTLLETINRNESIKCRIRTHKDKKKMSCKLRKLEDRIGSLETSSIEIKAEVQGLRKLITYRSKRSQLIRETLAEIDNHRKDQTYTEIKAVTACVQMLDNSKVLVLSGREGSGKSRNSLEIIRQMKEKHPEIDVIKLKRLTQFTDIIEKESMTIVLFEDVFGRINKQFCENNDIQILDILHSYINLGNLRVIFIMRNTVKHDCQDLLSSHDIFCHSIAEVDLNSKEFKLSQKEKQQIFINYCMSNEIEIIYKDMSSHHDPNKINIDKIKCSTIDKSRQQCEFSKDKRCITFNNDAVEDMMRSDPYHGFPQCCRLFTKNLKFTILGPAFFKYPSKSLLQEIENMRIHGIDNDVKGLKYVILVYILLNQDTAVDAALKYFLIFSGLKQYVSSINENNIDVQDHHKLFNECYNKTFGLKLPDIIYLYDELTCKYLIRNEKKIFFQHQALQDSVLISFCKVNPKANIPLLSIDHMIDIVRTQNYMEQEEEIVIKISKPYYPELAVKIISLININQRYDRSYRDRFMESKIITDNDVDLIYQLIVCIKNENQTLSPPLPSDEISYTYHYLPLYLLRNLGKLDDKRLTVDHTKGQMLISVVIGDHNITFFIDPFESLTNAFQSKYRDIIEWLLKIPTIHCSMLQTASLT
ncbi:unnamed protein product [Mytilus coruscus]|uniref:Novel STAND NTPase 3 domain-containing protein n=1 Tax=Mytilus coruscus TaxID=42192 RepID=A0A6J8C7A2_MYTCO|nr:unnamed protein product [Mytilus coruscus]